MIVRIVGNCKIEITSEHLAIYQCGTWTGSQEVLYRCELEKLPDVDFFLKKSGFMTDEYEFTFGKQKVEAKGAGGLSNHVKFYLALAVLAKYGDEVVLSMVNTVGNINPMKMLGVRRFSDMDAYWERARRLQKENASAAPSQPAAFAGARAAAVVPAPARAVATPPPPAPARAVAPPPPPAAAMFQFFAVIDGKQQGPYDEAQFGRLVNFGVVTRETYVWCEGMPEWKPAGDVERLQKLMGAVPPPMPGM